MVKNLSAGHVLLNAGAQCDCSHPACVARDHQAAVTL